MNIRHIFIIILFCSIVETFSIERIYGKTYIVDNQHENATDAGPGDIQNPFRTINAAAQVARAGDSVVVYPGIYRERVMPAYSGTANAPVVYTVKTAGTVTIKGSEEWYPEWKKFGVSKDVYMATTDPGLFREMNPFSVKAIAHKENRSLGQIFINGKPYAETSTLQQCTNTPGTWMTPDNGQQIIVHFQHQDIEPSTRIVEITVRNRIFAPKKRGLGHITVKGFIMEHCANQFPSNFWISDPSVAYPQEGALSTRSGHHWVIEYNTIRWANTLGIDCGFEGGYDLEGNQPKPEITGYHSIRYNMVTDNGACGIAGAGSPHTIISYNTIERNNYQGWTSPETGGIKVHFFTDGLIEGNIVRDNDAHGIWLDNACTNSRVTRNVVVNSRGAGIFTELADGPCLVDNNIVANTRLGDGIYGHDCSGMVITQNLLYANDHFGVYARVVTNRKTVNQKGEQVLVGAHDIQIFNNIFIDNYRGNICLPLNSERVYNNRSDYNLFINGAQWRWEGLLNTRFILTLSNGELDDQGNIRSEDNGDFSARKKLAEQLENSLRRKGIPQNKHPNYPMWIREPYLTLEWWQNLTGFDTHSFVPVLDRTEVENGAISKGLVNLSILELYFETSSNLPFERLKCPIPEQVSSDFYNQPFSADGVLPGPFQSYSEGHNRFVLKPD